MDLEKELQELGVTNSQLSKLTGISPQQIGQWCLGRHTMNRDSEKKIRDALKELRNEK